jgi:aldose 1-epimerase
MSRYQIDRQTAQGAEAYCLHDSERQAEAVLYPAFGNNCVVFRTTPDPDGRTPEGRPIDPVDMLMPPDNVTDLADAPFHGGNPILFPFPNRVRNGVYTFEGRTYRMAKLLAKGWDRGAGQAIHGLVADRAWTVEEASADADGATIRSSLQMDAFPDIAEQYPFPCRIAVTYRLREGVLTMGIEVANTGDGNLPMGFGIHPWFPLALRPGVKLPDASPLSPEHRAEVQVRVPAAAIWELEKLMPTGAVIPVDAEAELYDLRRFRPLNGHFFDHVFTRVQQDADGWSEAGMRDPKSGLETVLAADRPFREWVFYAPPDRPVIALEPYTCVTDAVNLAPHGIDAGLITLPPGRTWRGNIRFRLRRSGDG